MNKVKNILSAINYEYFMEYSSKVIPEEEGEKKDIIKNKNNLKKKLNNILTHYITKDIYDGFIYSNVNYLYDKSKFNPHNFLSDDFIDNFIFDLFFDLLDYYEYLIDFNYINVQVFNFINKIIYSSYCLSLFTKEQLNMDLTTFKSHWSKEFLSYSYSIAFNEKTKNMISDDILTKIDINKFKKNIISTIEYISSPKKNKATFDSTEKVFLKKLLPFVYEIFNDLLKSRDHFIKLKKFSDEFNENISVMIEKFLRSHNIRYEYDFFKEQKLTGILATDEIKFIDVKYNDKFLKLIIDSDKKSVNNLEKGCCIALLFYIHDFFIDEINYLYKNNREGYFKLAFVFCEGLTNPNKNKIDLNFFEEMVHKRELIKSKENFQNELIYKSMLPSSIGVLSLVVNLGLIKVERNYPIVDRYISPHHNLVMGTFASFSYFGLVYFYNSFFNIDDLYNYYLMSTDGGIIAYTIGSLLPKSTDFPTTTTTTTIRTNRINPIIMSRPRHRRTTDISTVTESVFIDHNHVFTKTSMFIEKKSPIKATASKNLMLKDIVENSKVIINPNYSPEDFSDVKFNDTNNEINLSLNNIYLELFDFRIVELAHLASSIDYRDSEFGYFNAFHLCFENKIPKDFNDINSDIFIISTTICYESYYERYTGNLFPDFNLSSLMNYYPVFFSFENDEIKKSSKRVFLTLFLLYLYRKDEDIITSIKKARKEMEESLSNEVFSVVINHYYKTIELIIALIEYLSKITKCKNSRDIIRMIILIGDKIVKLKNENDNKDSSHKIGLNGVNNNLYIRNTKGLSCDKSNDNSYYLSYNGKFKLDLFNEESTPANLYDTLLGSKLIINNLSDDFFFYSRNDRGYIDEISLSLDASKYNIIFGTLKISLAYDDIRKELNYNDDISLDDFMEYLSKAYFFKINILLNNTDTIIMIINRIRSLISNYDDLILE